jgi:hypothetical protein
MEIHSFLSLQVFKVELTVHPSCLFSHPGEFVRASVSVDGNDAGYRHCFYSLDPTFREGLTQHKPSPLLCASRPGLV